MATGNFHNVNASKVFAVSIEDADCFSELQQSLYFALEKLTKEKPVQMMHQGNDEDELRSYPSHVIEAIGMTKMFCGVEFIVKITVVVRSGYYHDCNLDWFLEYTTNGSLYTDYQIFTLPEIESILVDYGTIKEGLVKRMAPYALKHIETMTTQLTEMVEEMFTEYSTPMNVVARFSNGETLYEKA